MPRLTIDGIVVDVPRGATILDAARTAGVSIPTMCFLDGRRAETSCMVCVVKIVGMSRLVPSCATRCADGMAVESETVEVRTARRTALELLLGDHVGDCVGPCQSACPAHIDIPKMIGQIADGRFRDALITVKERVALPAVLGRVCPEICEKACRRAVADDAVAICLLKRFVAELDLASGHPYVPETQPPTGKRVAIVGAGPAGLSAAYYLLAAGHGCVVFDARPEPGGMLRVEVSPERLPREILDAEVAIIRQMGAEFRMGVRVSSPDALGGEFDSVLVAVGRIDGEFASHWGIEMAGSGLRIDSASMMTTARGIFAAGSAVSPSRLAVLSAANGRSVAAAISGFLAGEQPVAPGAPYSVHIGRLAEGEIEVFFDRASRSGRVAPSGDGFDSGEAVREAARCLHCECGKLDGCKLRNYGIEYQASPTRLRGKRGQATRAVDHPFVVFEPGKCISCGLCVQISADAGEELGLTFIGRGFNVRPGVPFDEPLSNALRKAALACADACPTRALVTREVRET